MSYHHDRPMTGAPYPPHPYAPPRPTNQNAIMALVFGLVFWPLGLYFGKKAKHEIAHTGEEGEGMATAGIILFWVHLAFFALAVVFMILYFVFIFLLIGSTVAAST